MSEVVSIDQPEGHIAASKRYFQDAFGDNQPHQSFGWSGTVEDSQVAFGATVSQDYNNATIALDILRTGETDVLVVFPQSLEAHHVFLTCIKNAIDQMWEQLSEYSLEGDEPNHAGFRLIAERRDSRDEDDEQWVDHTEQCTWPIPIDRTQPVIAYLFTVVGVEKPDDSPLKVASIVFATGEELGNDSGFPPFWCYADGVHFTEDKIEDEEV
ncbi:MAG: hypothetical protein JWO41_600 [Candidatus Saccharibacteria bacterium]|nr:hypothetical protein [Candidatus Saccharibacteria bacterium]